MNKLILGNSLEELKTLEDNSIDSIVTDPPYELGFMGKKWDNTGIAYNVDLWAECLRVLQPGGHLLAFSGTRTYHRMAVAIEDAGFEVRDMIEWVYGSGFPKSLNIGKAVDRLQGNEREVTGSYKVPDIKGDAYGTMNNKQGGSYKNIEVNKTKGNSPYEGWGTALKPAHEPICMARKPLAEKTVAENCLKYGTGGINIDESRVESNDQIETGRAGRSGASNFNASIGEKQPNHSARFPANLITDGSEEVRECFPDTKSGGGDKTNKGVRGKSVGNVYGNYNPNPNPVDHEVNSGSASRFFKSIIYQAKASKSERNKGCEELEEKENKEVYGNGLNTATKLVTKEQIESGVANREKVKNNHPTVKPIALMEYLIKMVTPKGGTVLDPFMGSGSTGVAAKKNGYDFIGIDMTPEYIEIAKARINHYEDPSY